MTREVFAGSDGMMVEGQPQLRIEDSVLSFEVGGQNRIVDSSDPDTVIVAIFQLTGLSVKYDNNGLIDVAGNPIYRNDVEITGEALISATNEFMERIGWMLT